MENRKEIETKVLQKLQWLQKKTELKQIHIAEALSLKSNAYISYILRSQFENISDKKLKEIKEKLLIGLPRDIFYDPDNKDYPFGGKYSMVFLHKLYWDEVLKPVPQNLASLYDVSAVNGSETTKMENKPRTFSFKESIDAVEVPVKHISHERYVQKEPMFPDGDHRTTREILLDIEKRLRRFELHFGVK